MSHYKLPQPRNKNRNKWAKTVPFPVPIAGITRQTAHSGNWKYYTGYLHENHVLVTQPQHVDSIYKMGYFGTGAQGHYEQASGYWLTQKPCDIPSDKDVQLAGSVRYLRQKKCDSTEQTPVKDLFHTCDIYGYKNISTAIEVKTSIAETTIYSSSPQHKLSSTFEHLPKCSGQGSEPNSQSEQLKTKEQTLDSWTSGTWTSTPDDPWESQDGKTENFWSSDNWNTEQKTAADFWAEELAKSQGEASKEHSRTDDILTAKDKIAMEMENPSGFDTGVELLQNAPAVTEKTELSKSGKSPKFEKKGKKAKKRKQTAEESKSKTVMLPVVKEGEDAWCKVVAEDSAAVQTLDTSNLHKCLKLMFEEAFFLSYGLGCLTVYKEDMEKLLNLCDLWHHFCNGQKDFVENYIAYHYYRSKGWVPKSGVKYGTNFLLYKQGPPHYHATYSVIVCMVDEATLENDPSRLSRPLTWSSLSALYRITEVVHKEVLFCYVIKPTHLTELDLLNPKCIPQFKVKEVVLDRWVPSQERQDSR